MDPKASPAAVAKIQAYLQDKRSVKVVQVQEGKISCPACSREIRMPKFHDRVVGVDLRCTCNTLLRIANQSEDEEETTEYELAETQGHTHEVELDAKGTGTSSEAKGHKHRVLGKKVVEANGHTHKLVEIDEDADDKKSNEEDKAKAAKLKDDEDDKDEGGIKDIPDAELIKYLVENPNPADEAFHENSEKKGWDNKQAEAVAYKFATRYAQFRTGGASKGKRPSDIVADQESMGLQVELEHTPNIDDAHKIVWDHLSEKKNSLYYSFLTVVEKSIEEGPESELFRGMLKLMEKMEK